jgi:hypothetical protein
VSKSRFAIELYLGLTAGVSHEMDEVDEVGDADKVERLEEAVAGPPWVMAWINAM